MWTKREIVIFFAGFEAFHTLAHLALSVSGQLPMQVVGFTVGVGPQRMGHRRQRGDHCRPALVGSAAEAAVRQVVRDQTGESRDRGRPGSEPRLIADWCSSARFSSMLAV
jgi:hypothetical protein